MQNAKHISIVFMKVGWGCRLIHPSWTLPLLQPSPNISMSKYFFRNANHGFGTNNLSRELVTVLSVILFVTPCIEQWVCLVHKNRFKFFKGV